MIGLEFILNLYNMQHQQLADKLSIRKQNINLWVKSKQNISKKYLPILSDIFGINEEYFQKELDDFDKLIIQREKLRKDIKPQIKDHYDHVVLGENPDLVEKPIYDAKEMNDIELEIEKARIINDFRNIMVEVNDDSELQMLEQISLILKHHKKERILNFTIDALSHYYGVLPDWVGNAEGHYFINEYLELAHKYDNEDELLHCPKK